MNIEEGKYYVVQTTEKGWEHEKYIMKVFPRPEYLREGNYRTETLGLHNGSLWECDWLESYIDREATTEEIDYFQSERNKLVGKVPGLGEMITGKTLDTFEDTIAAISDIVNKA